MAEVSIEYPQEGEAVSHPTYTFQIQVAEGARHVRLSIDGGPWLACRESLGLWWFDWHGYGPGEHEARARIEKPGEFVMHSDLRRFRVDWG
ncbi:MAG TPA: hypothetical protein DCM05_08270 [Elusimicrobia bacterium]|nr:hypothetical protein [Elusimicrobiota bacterium]